MVKNQPRETEAAKSGKQEPTGERKPAASALPATAAECVANPQPHPSFDAFVATIAALRAPDGCPWDREQTHGSIAHNMIEEAYEANTGKVIVDGFAEREIDPLAVPAVLVRNHGPFSWGKDAAQAVYHAVVLEEVCKMATRTEALRPGVEPAPQYLQDKHYLRKHGPNAYYGQGGAH